MAEEFITGMPDELKSVAAAVDQSIKTGTSRPALSLEQAFKGSSMLPALKEHGWATYTDGQTGKQHIVSVQTNPAGEIMAIAASIPRDPGRSESYLQQVADFAESRTDRKDKIALYHRVYRGEGIVNNAINKAAAMIATEGRFKVRYVKGQRGKAGDKAAEEFQLLLDWYTENVNSRALDSVVTGARGIPSLIVQAARSALIEGDAIMRENWDTVSVPVLAGKAFSLPINIQMFSAAHVDIPEDLAGNGLNLELIYWTPPREFIQRLQTPRDKNVKKYLDKLIPRDIQAELIKNGSYLLDPALMSHIKHRGTGFDVFGESMIESAIPDVAYKRALMALDVTTIENLINRLVIIKVGSDDHESVYHAPEVANARLQLLQRMVQRAGPSATVLWAGPDIDVVEVSAHNAILAMDDRYKQADSRIRSALGVPAALLTGEASDGKAAGWAAKSGLGAQLIELQNQFANMLRSMAEKIAVENNYQDVDVVWEFNSDLLADKEVIARIALQAFQLGLYSSTTALEELGQNAEAEEVRQAADVQKGYKDEPFGPPKGAMTNNTMGAGGGEGRPPNSGPDPRDGRESKTDQENK